MEPRVSIIRPSLIQPCRSTATVPRWLTIGVATRASRRTSLVWSRRSVELTAKRSSSFVIGRQRHGLWKSLCLFSASTCLVSEPSINRRSAKRQSQPSTTRIIRSRSSLRVSRSVPRRSTCKEIAQAAGRVIRIGQDSACNI